MFIKTVKFGEIEIDDSLIFEFVDPILGYEDIKNYTIIDAQKDNSLSQKPRENIK